MPSCGGRSSRPCCPPHRQRPLALEHAQRFTQRRLADLELGRQVLLPRQHVAVQQPSGKDAFAQLRRHRGRELAGGPRARPLVAPTRPPRRHRRRAPRQRGPVPLHPLHRRTRRGRRGRLRRSRPNSSAGRVPGGAWTTSKLATLEWVHWFNHRRLHGYCQNVPPAEFDDLYHQHQALAEPLSQGEPSLH